jgi:hypothetical protein
MNLFVPVSVTLLGAAVQFDMFKLSFCCKVRSVEGDGQEITTVLVAV